MKLISSLSFQKSKKDKKGEMEENSHLGLLLTKRVVQDTIKTNFMLKKIFHM